LKGLGKTFVHKSFLKSFFENHSMGQALSNTPLGPLFLEGIREDMTFYQRELKSFESLLSRGYP